MGGEPHNIDPSEVYDLLRAEDRDKFKEKIEASKDAAKSKAAIVRETRRLIAALEVTLPGALWTYLDEAAATT